MKRQTRTFVKRMGLFTAAFVFSVAGLSLLGGGSNASAAGQGFKVINNCSKTTVFGYNKYNTPPGTGAYYTVKKGSTYTVNTSSTGIFRVELPKGVYNTLVYSGHYNTLRMC